MTSEYVTTVHLLVALNCSELLNDSISIKQIPHNSNDARRKLLNKPSRATVLVGHVSKPNSYIGITNELSAICTTEYFYFYFIFYIFIFYIFLGPIHLCSDKRFYPRITLSAGTDYQ